MLLAAERLGVSAGRSVVFEDAPYGLEAGRRAGMRTVAVLTTHAHLEADVVVRSLDDLPADAIDRLVPE
jgi:sugar-phosphatase